MSISFTAFYLKPTGPWRLGEPGVGMESSGVIGHSDTLFSALCHAWLAAGELEILKNELASPNFRISSLFPFAQVSASPPRHVHLWPRPLLDFEDPQKQMPRKLLKNASFVTEEILQYLQSSHVLPDDWKFVMGTKTVATAPEADALKAVLEGKSLWELGQHTLAPRVVIDRFTNTTNLYYVARLIFHECGGFFFLFQGSEAWRARLRQALQVLQHQGIGSERTYGFGQFKLAGEEMLTFKEPPAANGHFLFSLFAPQSQELAATLGGGALYTLLRRSGFVDSPVSRSQRRAQVHMVAEGAVLSARPTGRVADVRPPAGSFPDPVWRFGMALSLPAKIDWSHHA